MLTWVLDSSVRLPAALRGIVGVVKPEIMSQIVLLMIEWGVFFNMQN